MNKIHNECTRSELFGVFEVNALRKEKIMVADGNQDCQVKSK